MAGKKKIGLNLYSLREFTQTADGLADTLARVKDMGYEGVQVSGIKGLEPEQIEPVVRRSGLPVAATHVGWEVFRDDPQRAVAIHKLYGCAHPAIGMLPGEYYSLAGAERFVKEAGVVVKGLRAAGMDFSYHNHSHELARYEGRTWLERVLEGSAAGGLGFEIDTYWIQAGGGDPAEWVARCKGRIPLLHVKDMIVTPKREQRYAPVGSGNLSWDRIFAAAEAGGVEWYLVEQDSFYEGEDPFAEVAKSCTFLRKRLR